MVPQDAGRGLRGKKLVSITPSDSTEYDPPLIGLMIGTGGTVVVVNALDDSEVTIPAGVAATGAWIPLPRIKQVKSSGTSATDLVGFVE